MDKNQIGKNIENRCGDCAHWKPLAGDRGVSYATCFNEKSSYCMQTVSSSCGCSEFEAFATFCGRPIFAGYDPGQAFKRLSRLTASGINGVVDPQPGAAQYVIVPPKGYGCLGRVFQAALKQAACGKGMHRHGEDNTDYMDQTTMRDTRELGIGFPIGQGRKKGLEAVRLRDLKGVEAAKAELLGAINYYASAYLALDAGWAGEAEESDNG